MYFELVRSKLGARGKGPVTSVALERSLSFSHVRIDLSIWVGERCQKRLPSLAAEGSGLSSNGVAPLAEAGVQEMVEARRGIDQGVKGFGRRSSPRPRTIPRRRPCCGKQGGDRPVPFFDDSSNQESAVCAPRGAYEKKKHRSIYIYIYPPPTETNNLNK